MLETLSPEDPAALKPQVRAYIEDSTGKPTLCQMEWLAQQLRQRTGTSQPAAYYKEQYNARLLEMVGKKRRELEAGSCQPEAYLVAGVDTFLRQLKALGWHLVLSSGTDEADVAEEAALLGVGPLFDRISGAPRPKDEVLQDLIRQAPQARIVVIGDGTAEIAAAKARNLPALGIASDELRRQGMDPRKQARLIQAGADVIFGDFTQLDSILAVMEGR